MNKNILIVVAVVVIAVLGAGYFFIGKSKTNLPGIQKQTGGNVITSIRDALSSSASLECSFTDETGRQVKSWIKNGAVRADIASSNSEEAGSVILKNKKVYFWNDKGAFSMDLSDQKPTEGQSGNQLSEQEKEVMDNLEKYKNQCKPAIVSDSLFNTPSNVKFQDFSELINSVPTVPAGSNSVPKVDSDQYKKLLEQFQDQQDSEAGN